MSSSTVQAPIKDSGPEVPRFVVFKLYLHTLLMVFLPLGTYFFTAKYCFEGEFKTTYAALSAAGIANVVLLSFIITAFVEDSSVQTKDKKTE
ncbi:18582_t:CDS:2 [Acaulospora morrowiae]|uniref:18582_t:CDS:1 n=1 Tax=Acaulospora morrowiae TaxID=94023 RepID=A0A9N8YWB7_9GLOM|nr:18582_t:CDS:2 [Acaulospora morrowiae]